MRVSKWYKLSEGVAAFVTTSDDVTALVYAANGSRKRYEPLHEEWFEVVDSCETQEERSSIVRMAVGVQSDMHQKASYIFNTLDEKLGEMITNRVRRMLSGVPDSESSDSMGAAHLLAIGALDVVLNRTDGSTTSRVQIVNSIDFDSSSIATRPVDYTPSAVENWFVDARRRFVTVLPVAVESIPFSAIDQQQNVSKRKLCDY